MVVVRHPVIKKFKSKYLTYLYSKANKIFSTKSKGSKFVLSTILSQKKYLSINISSGILLAFFEGISLSIIFLLLSVISSNSEDKFRWESVFFVGEFENLTNWLNNLSFINIFVGLILIAVTAQIIQSTLRYINLLSTSYIEARCLADITKKIHKQIFSFSFRCSQSYKVGDLSEYVNQCPETIRQQILGMNEIIVNLLTSLVYVYVLLKLSIWNLLIVSILFLISKRFLKELFSLINKISYEVTNIKVKISETIIESFQGIRFLHSSGLIKEVDNQLFKKTSYLEKSLRARGQKIQLIQPILSLLPIILISVVCIISIFTIERSSIIATLGTFAVTLQRLNYRIVGISTNAGALADNASRISRLDNIISPKDKEFRRVGGEKINFPIKQITFSKVNFNYSKENNFGLNDLNFNLNLGESTAIVGVSGSGKSSILDLLLGLYEPKIGRIIANGKDIKTLDLNSWQKQISIVSQDIFLFNTSILNNLKFGNPEITFNEIKKACEASGANDFIKELPMGYKTIIGERGFKLSGGQRQRIAISRALVSEKPVLVFDESTSALDSISENIFQNYIERIKQSKIILVVAHRLSTIKNSDNIIVLDNGSIVESGKHSKLIKNDYIYKKLWDIQSKD